MLAFTLLSLANRADDEAAALIGVLILLLVVVAGIFIYFLPTIIALFRHHHQWGTITIVNLFFGWTFLGWVFALAWSVSAKREQ